MMMMMIFFCNGEFAQPRSMSAAEKHLRKQTRRKRKGPTKRAKAHAARKTETSVSLHVASGDLVYRHRLGRSNSSNSKHLRNKRTANSTSSTSSIATRRGPLMRRECAHGARARLIVMITVIPMARNRLRRGRRVRRGREVVTKTGPSTRAPRARTTDAARGIAAGTSAAGELAANRTLGDSNDTNDDDALRPRRVSLGFAEGGASWPCLCARGP
jgi:hypothetical protein